MPTQLQGRTEKVGDALGGESRRRESKGTYECCAAYSIMTSNGVVPRSTMNTNVSPFVFIVLHGKTFICTLTLYILTDSLTLFLANTMSAAVFRYTVIVTLIDKMARRHLCCSNSVRFF